MPNANGCDSVLTLNLTIYQPDTNTQTLTACDSYFWTEDSTTYSTSGLYAVNLLNSAGCDSVVQLSLTIETVDSSVTDNGNATLTANQAGASYQWYACDPGFTLLPGETGQSFAPVQNGNYAVVVTNGSCVDTSGCHFVLVVGLESEMAFSGVSVYPNPTTGNIYFSPGNQVDPITIRVMNAMGQEILRREILGQNSTEIAIDAPAGIYFLKLNDPSGATRVLRLVKE